MPFSMSWTPDGGDEQTAELRKHADRLLDRRIRSGEVQVFDRDESHGHGNGDHRRNGSTITTTEMIASA